MQGLFEKRTDLEQMYTVTKRKGWINWRKMVQDSNQSKSKKSWTEAQKGTSFISISGKMPQLNRIFENKTPSGVHGLEEGARYAFGEENKSVAIVALCGYRKMSYI